MYDQIHQEQVVAGMATQRRVENPSVEEQVIVQEIPQVPIVDQTQEQIVDITGLVNPQFSILLLRLLRHKSLLHFLPSKSLLRPCTTKSIRNRSLQVR